MAKPPQDDTKTLSDNRKARHDYHLLDRFEAGLVLQGTEVKAARDGQVQLRDGYAEVAGGEAWLVNVHIGHYSHGNIANHEIGRRRKLLLHRGEIVRLGVKTREKGLTLIPTRVYLKKGRIKCEIALARGKKEHDKREAIRTREREEEARAAMRRHNVR
jgi:SsrA-binding protein